MSERFVLHWGEMGTRWGVNRTVSQIHALLYIRARPMHADEIAETLSVARSNVSNSVRELQNWELVKIVHLLGDRRDHFETSGDVWELFRVIVRQRKLREFDPTLDALDKLERDAGVESASVKARLKELRQFMMALDTWSDAMLRLEPATLTRVIKLGAKVQQFLPKKE